LCVAFRHFPIFRSHPYALLAAEATEAAGAQFWEMHDILYQHQDELTLPYLEEYAAWLGLDLRRFRDDLSTRAHAGVIRSHLHSGALSGVHGTPSFFINGERYDGSWDFASLCEATGGRSGAELR